MKSWLGAFRVAGSAQVSHKFFIPKTTVPESEGLKTQIEELLERLYSFCNLIFETHEEISTFDVESLNPPGVEDALRRLGWEIDEDMLELTEAYDAPQE